MPRMPHIRLQTDGIHTTRKYVGKGAALAICALILCGIVIYFIKLVTGPVYNGKPLRVWVAKLGDFESSFGFHPPPNNEAIKAISTIGPKAVPRLLEWLPKPESSLTRCYEWILQFPQVAGLIVSTNNPPPSPDNVVLAFRVLGPAAKDGVPHLERIAMHLSHKYGTGSIPPNAFTYAVKCLAFCGSDSVQPLLHVASKLEGRPEWKYEVIQGIGLTKSNGAPAVPALVRWSTDKDARIRDAAITALCEIGKDPKATVPVLVAALQRPDETWSVRGASAAALGSFGPDAKEAVPALIDTLGHPSPFVRGAAITSLGAICGDRDLLAPLLAKRLQYDLLTANRVAAATVLGKLGGKVAYDALTRATNDEHPWVQAQAFDSLKRIEPNTVETRAGGRQQ